MDLSKLTSQQRQLRSMIRGFLLAATVEQMEQEKAISLERGDVFRAEVIQELIDEESQSCKLLTFVRVTPSDEHPDFIEVYSAVTYVRVGVIWNYPVHGWTFSPDSGVETEDGGVTVRYMREIIVYIDSM